MNGARMTIDEIKELLSVMEEHQLGELELEREGVRLRLVKVAATAVPAPQPATPAAPPPAGPVASPDGDEGPAPEPSDLVVVSSPIVGTFYCAPDPASPPFVDVGDTVRKGQVLCIIEAMKLMNEIDSEHEGQIVDVYVENGQPVQYGERLFSIRVA